MQQHTTDIATPDRHPPPHEQPFVARAAKSSSRFHEFSRPHGRATFARVIPEVRIPTVPETSVAFFILITGIVGWIRRRGAIKAGERTVCRRRHRKRLRRPSDQFVEQQRCAEDLVADDGVSIGSIGEAAFSAGDRRVRAESALLQETRNTLRIESTQASIQSKTGTTPDCGPESTIHSPQHVVPDTAMLVLDASVDVDVPSSDTRADESRSSSDMPVPGVRDTTNDANFTVGLAAAGAATVGAVGVGFGRPRVQSSSPVSHIEIDNFPSSDVAALPSTVADAVAMHKQDDDTKYLASESKEARDAGAMGRGVASPPPAVDEGSGGPDESGVDDDSIRVASPDLIDVVRLSLLAVGGEKQTMGAYATPTVAVDEGDIAVEPITAVRSATDELAMGHVFCEDEKAYGPDREHTNESVSATGPEESSTAATETTLGEGGVSRAVFKDDRISVAVKDEQPASREIDVVVANAGIRSSPRPAAPALSAPFAELSATCDLLAETCPATFGIVSNDATVGAYSSSGIGAKFADGLAAASTAAVGSATTVSSSTRGDDGGVPGDKRDAVLPSCEVSRDSGEDEGEDGATQYYGPLKWAFRKMIRSAYPHWKPESYQACSMSLLALERTVDECVEVEQVLSAGTFAEVSAVKHKHMEMPEESVVLKVLQKKHDRDEDDDDEFDAEGRQCFLTEMRTIIKLGIHPNIVRVFAINDMTSGLPMLMERALCTLTHLLAADTRHISTLTRVTRDVASALEYMHSLDLVNNDVKPDNVLIFYSAEEQVCTKLCDFAFATAIGEEREADSGTMGYIPLENMGRDVISEVSHDGFAMGALMDCVFLKDGLVGGDMFYETLTEQETAEKMDMVAKGKRQGIHWRALPEFNEWDYEITRRSLEKELYNKLAHPDRFHKDVPWRRELANWIAQLLSKDPSKRPSMASVKEFLCRLVCEREAIDGGLATLGHDGEVVCSRAAAKAKTKAQVRPISLSSALGTAGGSGPKEGTVEEWPDLVSPSALAGSS